MHQAGPDTRENELSTEKANRFEIDSTKAKRFNFILAKGTEMKSRLKTIIFGVALSMLYSNYLYALPDAKTTYLQAKKNQETLSYMSQSEREESGSPVYDVFVQFVDSDGTKLTRREIKRAPSGGKTVSDDLTVISNADGLFHITPTQVLKIEFQLGRKPISTDGLNIDYSIKQGRKNGVNCWIVTRKFAMDNKTFKSYVESLPDDLKKGVQFKDFEENFFPIDITYIDQKLLLPVKTENYTLDGRKVAERDFGKLTLNPAIDMKWFAIDADNNVNIAKKFKDYSEASHREVKNDLPKPAIIESPSFFSRAASTFIRVMEQLLYSPWTARVFLVIGVICIILTIFAKWKRK